MSDSSNKSFASFNKKVTIFLLPIIVSLLVLDVVSLNIGELTSVKYVVRNQLNSNILYGRKTIDQELRKYKYELFLKRGGDVIAIGSSRILPLREEFFAPYSSFSNVGSIAHNLGDVLDFVDRMSTSTQEKKVILSLDYYWFGEKREVTSYLTSDLMLRDSLWDWRAHIFAIRYILDLLIFNPNKLIQYFDSNNKYYGSYGFQALDGNGYRPDGSYLYTSYIKELEIGNKYIDREQPPVIDRIRNGSGSFIMDSVFDKTRLILLDQIIKKLKSKNYYVIGLGMPFSSEVYNELMINPHHNKLFSLYQSNIPKVFSDNGFKYFDYSDLNSLKLNDLYMFDGVHTTETAMAYILRDIITKLPNDIFKERDGILYRLNVWIDNPNSTTFTLAIEP